MTGLEIMRKHNISVVLVLNLSWESMLKHWKVEFIGD